ncbi:hypothetical protein ACFX1X_004220 [Malus domestica]
MPTEDVSAKKEKEKSQVVRICAGQFCIDLQGAWDDVQPLLFIAMAPPQGRVKNLLGLGFLSLISINSTSPIFTRTVNLVLYLSRIRFRVLPRLLIALGFNLLRYDLADLGLEAHVLNDPWYSCRKASRAENDPTLGPNCYFGPKHCPLASEVLGLEEANLSLRTLMPEFQGVFIEHDCTILILLTTLATWRPLTWPIPKNDV